MGFMSYPARYCASAKDRRPIIARGDEWLVLDAIRSIASREFIYLLPHTTEKIHPANQMFSGGIGKTRFAF